MPLAYGDPGLFICSIPDGGEPDVKEPTPAIHISPPPNAWLVLALCRSCNVKTRRYCTAHNLAFLDRQGFGPPNPSKSPAQRGVRWTEPQTRPEGRPR